MTEQWLTMVKPLEEKCMWKHNRKLIWNDNEMKMSIFKLQLYSAGLWFYSRWRALRSTHTHTHNRIIVKSQTEAYIVTCILAVEVWRVFRSLSWIFTFCWGPEVYRNRNEFLSNFYTANSKQCIYLIRNKCKLTRFPWAKSDIGLTDTHTTHLLLTVI